MMKTLWLCLMLFFLSGCVSKNTYYDNGNVLVTPLEVLRNDDYLVIADENSTQVYRLDTNKLVAEADMGGLVENGFYLVDLDKNKVTLSDQTISVTDFLHKEEWDFAYVNASATKMLYGFEGSLYRCDLEDQAVFDLGLYNPNWQALGFVENHFYFKNEGQKIKVDLDDLSVSLVEDDESIDDFSLDATLKRDGKSIRINEFSILLNDENEEMIDFNKNHMLTKLDTTYYFYHLEDLRWYSYEFDGKYIQISGEDLLVVNSDGQLQTISENHSKEVGMVYCESQPRYHSCLLDAPLIEQMPDYPTGCETISAMMLLEYMDLGIDTDTFIDTYLEMDDVEVVNGVLYGPSPYDKFLGDPRNDYSFGCMVPVMERALSAYLGSHRYVENTTGLSLEEICAYYIDQDIPVMIWATIYMEEAFPTQSWECPDGSTYTWLANEHCLLLVGYNQSSYYLNDPYSGEMLTYPKWLVEDRYETFGRQSLTILPH